MKRWLFNIVAALSLVLSVATTALWVRGFFVDEAVIRSRLDPARLRWSTVRIQWFYGKFTASYEYQVTPPGDPFNPVFDSGWGHSSAWMLPYFAWWHFNHQSYFDGPNGTLSVEKWAVGFRIWPLAALAAFLPTCWLFVKIWPRPPARAGLCENCGYDLRATPERCPECGTIRPAVKGAAT